MNNKDKVLIVKTGYSETLDKQISHFSSLGDVLRTTVILHLYKDCHVTWLVDESAFQLLYNNPYIDKILIYNLTSILQLKSQQFDTIINFEKVPGLCALSDSIKAWRRHGFRFDEISGTAQAYDNAEAVFYISNEIERKRNHSKTWQEALFEMLGHKWKREEYILGYKSPQKITHDVGFNWAVGKSYPTKAWPKSYWEKLATLLEPNYSVSWQMGLNDLYAYIDWINSCRLLITNDSLGLHIALALKKKVLVLYGATHSKEAFLYGCGKSITPGKYFDCMPCFQPECNNAEFCMDYISPESVLEQVNELSK